MKILVTGAGGFVGSSLIRALLERVEALEVVGIDNFSRPGSEVNRMALRELGVKMQHADVRDRSDIELLPNVDWVIEAAANASVLAGTGGSSASFQVIDQNLMGMINVLDHCRRCHAGMTFLSTSRVYSIGTLLDIKYEVRSSAFKPIGIDKVDGLSSKGINERFSTSAPISLYGATKLAAEVLALELGELWSIPVAVLRCGVLAGAGQFARPDQGIFSYWIHSYRWRRPLCYIGFKGSGYQVRDCLHPRDLASILHTQISSRSISRAQRLTNISGGMVNSVSLAQLTAWCASRFGDFEIQSSDQERDYDVPWLVLDSSNAAEAYKWEPAISTETIFEEIAQHADAHPRWLDLSAP